MRKVSKKASGFCFALLFLAAISFGTAEANSCATTDLSKAEISLPCLNLGNTSYWLKLPIVSASPITFGISEFGDNNAPGDLAECAFIDFSTSTFSIPCVTIANNKCWIDLNLPGGGSAGLTLKNFGCSPCLNSLLDQSAVTATFVASGDVFGQVGTATLRNSSSQPQWVSMGPGISLINTSSPGNQNTTVFMESCVQVGPYAEVTAPLYGACIELDDHPPAEGDVFTAQKEGRRDLVALTQAVDRYYSFDPESYESYLALYTAQLGIWVITDNADVSGFADQGIISLDNLKALFRSAGLNPGNYQSFK